ncbi:MAG: hypothetical protein DRN83_00365 [Hadesarchaea archaeon]|nr:MAG: hypothetical protein DRN83_00365 [Hadesarchaea archaeon]HDI12892.1 hypothetical protein [Hadesarchaea archaeon]
MLGEKKKKPAIEIGLSLGDALKSMGLADIMDRVLNLIQQGKLEVKVELGTKKTGKVPANITIRLKKAE